MNVPATSPWLQMAHDDAREWFRDHPGAPLTEFTAWAERYEVQEVLRAGFGWRPGDPATRRMQEALDAAWTGLMAARDVEAALRGRRAAADVPLAGHRSAGERSAGPGATAGASPWWDRQDGAA